MLFTTTCSVSPTPLPTGRSAGWRVMPRVRVSTEQGPASCPFPLACEAVSARALHTRRLHKWLRRYSSLVISSLPTESLDVLGGVVKMECMEDIVRTNISCMITLLVRRMGHGYSSRGVSVTSLNISFGDPFGQRLYG